jgi:FdhD protein
MQCRLTRARRSVAKAAWAIGLAISRQMRPFAVFPRHRHAHTPLQRSNSGSIMGSSCANFHFIRRSRRGLDTEIFRRGNSGADGQGRSNGRRTPRDHREIPPGQQPSSEAALDHHADTWVGPSFSGGILVYRRNSSRNFHVELERHFYTTSSCGVCGKTSLDALRITREVYLNSSSPKVAPQLLVRLPEVLARYQSEFSRTGGIHASALFDVRGRLCAISEDVGRHNALDRLIGNELLAGRTDFSDLLLLVSGRASFELVQKSVMAGIPVMAAVGAPSSLAVELAQRYGMTLVGFLRDNRFNLYSGASRVG